MRLVKVLVSLFDTDAKSTVFHDAVMAACDGIYEDLILSEPTAQLICDDHNDRLNLLKDRVRYDITSLNQANLYDVNVILAVNRRPLNSL